MPSGTCYHPRVSQTVGKTSIRLNANIVLPIAIFVVALLIRSIGIGWGLKNDLHYQSYHPDEQVNWAVSQRVEPAKLQFDPKFYSYGTLYFTVLGVASDIVTVYGGGSGKNDVNAFWDFGFEAGSAVVTAKHSDSKKQVRIKTFPEFQVNTLR